MDSFEAQLRQMMRQRSVDVDSITIATGQIVRRARRGRAVTVSLAAASLVALVFSGVALSTSGGLGPSPEAAGTGDATPYPGDPRLIDTRDDPETARIEIATGERKGRTWSYSLYRDNPPRDRARGDVWCTSFTWFRGPSQICGGVYVPDDDFSSIGRHIPGGSQDALLGQLDRRVARVVVDLDGYAPFEVPVIPGPRIDPPEDDPGVNFVVAFIPYGSTGEVIVVDAAGNLLQRKEIID
jgi:hypothetical protein